MKFHSQFKTTFPNPIGIEPSSPGLRGTSYPGIKRGDKTTPTGLRPVSHRRNHNPVGVENSVLTLTQGSSSLATLGFEPESLWDSPDVAALRFAGRLANNSPKTL